MASKKQRLDLLCVDQGIAPSRQRAQALILAGEVLVDGQPLTKAGCLLNPTVELRLREQPLPYVSRGGVKLAAALDQFDLQCADAVALDIGASTGGFTDCLLQRGTRHVFAVDVGYGQLAWKLRQDSRVTVIERCNARHLMPDLLRANLDDPTAWPPTIAVIDVSFISLTLVLPAVCRCLDPGSPIVALVKPQFEAGRDQVGKGGVVRDPDARQRAIRKVVDWATQQGYTLDGGIDSPLPGPKGNVEHLLLLVTPDTPGPAHGNTESSNVDE